MISITEDSEFMTNLLPANPVPAGNRFVAIKDAQSNPAVVAIGQDQELNLIIQKNGVPVLVDYGKLCGLQGNVLAFDVYQDIYLNLWFVIATDAGNNQSSLYLLVNIPASSILEPSQDSIIKSGLVFNTIHGIYMSNFVQTVGPYQLPQIFVAFQPLGKITSEDQLGYLNMTANSQGQLTILMNNKWKLATDPLKIIDVTFGSAVVGKGAFVLYESTEGLNIQFRVFEGHDFSVEVAVPSGAACLNSYIDLGTGYTVLLVGGDQITMYTSQQYVIPDNKGTIITTKDTDLGIKGLHLSRTETELTMWYTTSSDAVHYYAANLDDLNDGLLVPLLPSGSGGQISGLLSAASTHSEVLVNTLLSVNHSGFITMLQQATDSGMWEKIPFYAPSKTNNMEVPSFTIRVRATSDGSNNVNEKTPNCQLHLVSSSLIQVTSNGASTSISPDGVWMSCDSNSVLTLIVATADLACVTIQVDQFKSETGFIETIPSFIINPTEKLLPNLLPITSGADLLNAKTQTGEPLLKPGSVSPEDADNAAKIISELTRTNPLVQAPSPGSFQRQRRRVKFSEETKAQRPIHIAGVLPEDPEARARMFALGDWSSFWDFFYDLYEEAEEVLGWSLQKLDDVYHLVLHWLDQEFRFVLDSFQAVGKAISWVFKKITVAVDKLIDYIGFLFSWDDILQTSDTISTYINAGLSYGNTQIGELKSQIDTYLQTLRVSATRGKLKPSNVLTASNEQDPQSTDPTKAAQNGVAYNFAAYHMQHSGYATDSTIIPKIPSNSFQDSGQELKAIWDSISKEVDVVKYLVEDISQDIKDIFTPGTDTNEIFARLKDELVNAAIDTIQNVADALLEAVSLCISEFQDLGNAEIEVPIFSALWDLISDGRKFTVFNCLSLILAIPSTILFKLAAGKAPPALEGRLTEKTFGMYVTGDPKLDPTLASDIKAVTECVAVTSGGLAVIVMALTFVTDHLSVSTVKSNKLLVNNQGFQPNGHPELPTAAGNAMDAATIFLDTFTLITSWPLKYKYDQNLYWTVWGLELSNAIFLACSRIVGWKFGFPRVETKRFVGIWEVVTSFPIYIVDIIIDVHEFDLPDGDPDKDDALTTRHVIEETATLIKNWAFGVAALNDEVNEPVTAVALAVMGIATVISSSFKFVDFVFWYEDRPKEPGPVRPPGHGLPPPSKKQCVFQDK